MRDPSPVDPALLDRPTDGEEKGIEGIPTSDRFLDRQMVAQDLWPRQTLQRREGRLPTPPERVFWPRNWDEVARVVREARLQRRSLVPFGAGSGVSAGVRTHDRAWVLDVKRLNRLLEVDAAQQTCTVQAGLVGERLERLLNARGLTLGHFPSSIYCSTVGGWVACRSAGQLSSRYGKIEDIVLRIEGVDGRGAYVAADLRDPSTGPGALRLLIGTEGALCVITQVTFRTHPIATHRWLRGFRFDALDVAVPALRALLHSGEAPSVLRLYDPLDTFVAGGVAAAPESPNRIIAGPISCAGLENSGPEIEAEDPSLLDAIVQQVSEVALFKRPKSVRRVIGRMLSSPLLTNALIGKLASECKVIVGIEGDGDEVAQRAERISARLSALGGTDAGHEVGERWLLHRHRVSYRMAKAFAAGGWVDTMEVATGWENVVPLYEAVRDALRDVAVVMCHFSHAYVDGACLYFTFAGGGHEGEGPRSALARYDLCWERAMATCRRMGANVSHHHGVGRSKAKAIRPSLGQQRLLMALKQTMDPDGVLNPGVLDVGTKTGLAAGGER